MPEYGLTLLSGGLDSTTVTAYAKDRSDFISAITFYYGQAHSKEVDCAGHIAGILGVEQELVDISFLSKIAWYSALTNPDRFPVPAERSRRADRIRRTDNLCSAPQHDISFLGRCQPRKQGAARHRTRRG